MLLFFEHPQFILTSRGLRHILAPLKSKPPSHAIPRPNVTLVMLSNRSACTKITARPFSACWRERVRYRQALTLCLLFAASTSLAAARDLAVVSNKANAVAAITLPDLVKVCKGQNNHWPDGKSVTFIMRNPSVPEMKFFLEKVYELPESQVRDLIATANHGRTGHPAVMIVDSDEDLVNKVASIPGAIGVVDVYAINSSVAVVKVAGKLPLEPGYLLHGN